MSSPSTSSPEPETGTWESLRRPIWLFDPVSFRGVYANPAALRLWGASTLEELLARDFSKLSPAVLARTERLAVATAQGAEVSEQWTFYPNGAPVTVQTTISDHRLQDGRVVLLFEASPVEIEPSERRAIEALRHTSTLITLLDQGGQIIFANPAVFAAYGPDERAIDARFVEPERGALLLEKALAGETAEDVLETTGRRWHHVDARPVLDPVTGAAGVLLNETDVTQRIEAERARVAAEQKAAMALARQKFLTDMSHELRTPLNAVIGFSGLLNSAGLGEEQADQAGRIHEAGQQLLVVVNQMIRLSEGEGGDSKAGGVESADAGPQTPTAPPDGSADQPIRVLYVDDNASNRVLVQTLLRTQGIDCRTADDGREGVDAAKIGVWDVILMDIQMPLMDGIQAARAIRSMGPAAGEVPILAVTANTLANQVEDYVDAGMNDLIAKPIQAVELISKVYAWAEVARAQTSEVEAARAIGP